MAGDGPTQFALGPGARLADVQGCMSYAHMTCHVMFDACHFRRVPSVACEIAHALGGGNRLSGGTEDTHS